MPPSDPQMWDTADTDPGEDTNNPDMAMGYDDPAPTIRNPPADPQPAQAPPSQIRLTPELMVKVWNFEMQGTPIAQVAQITPARRRALRRVAFQTCRNSPECWEDVCRDIARSPFHRGEASGRPGWTAT